MVDLALEAQLADVDVGLHQRPRAVRGKLDVVRRQPDRDAGERQQGVEALGHLSLPSCRAGLGSRGRGALVRGVVAAAGAHAQARAVAQLHLDAAELAVAPRVRGLVGEQVVEPAVAEDPTQACREVVAAPRQEAARVLGERDHAVPKGLEAAPLQALAHSGSGDHGAAAEARVPSWRLGHETRGVERVEHHPRPGRCVGHATQVEVPGVRGAQPHQEPVGEEQDQLASGKRSERAHHLLERLQRLARVVHDLDQHALGALRGLEQRQALAEVGVRLEDLLHREAGGLGVAAVDHLRLVLRQVGHLVGLDPALLDQAQALDGGPQGGTVARELLGQDDPPAGGDEGHRVVRGDLLVHELQERGAGLGRVLRRDVEIVHHEDDRPPLAPHGRRRRGRGKTSGGRPLGGGAGTGASSPGWARSSTPK